MQEMANQIGPWPVKLLVPNSKNPGRRWDSQIAQIPGGIPHSPSNSLTNASVASAPDTLAEGRGVD